MTTTHTPGPWRWGWLEQVRGVSPHHGGPCVVAYRLVCGPPSECPDLEPSVFLTTDEPGTEYGLGLRDPQPRTVIEGVGYGQGCEGWGVDAGDADARLIAAAPAMLEALREIAKGEGAFSRDPLEHAGNCIDSMKEIARAALRQVEGE